MWPLRVVAVALGVSVVIGGVAMLACSSSSSTPPTSTPVETGANETGDSSPDAADATDSFDASADSTFPPAYAAGDLSLFQYSWFGTGVSGNFALDRDCGVTSRGQLAGSYGGSYAGPDAMGVAPATECESFKSLALSAPVLDAMARKSTTICTDDFPSITITLVDGGKLTSVGEQCTMDEPYKTLVPRMDALRKSAAFDAGDGG